MDSPVEDSQGDSISVEAINYLGLCTTQLSKSDQGSSEKGSKSSHTKNSRFARFSSKLYGTEVKNLNEEIEAASD
jgi:hypothetical protein